MAGYGKRNGPARGIKFITAAMGHRRGDKYLFANRQDYRCTSYRALWIASRSQDSFEVWLKNKGVLAA
jgi:hypothetical protein